MKLLKPESKAYGGELLKKRKARQRGRPLDTKNSMHLVLRSSRAKGDWSFRRPNNQKRITQIIEKFSRRYGIKIISLANAGNHLHFQLKLSNRHGYKPFIRAITSAICMAVTGVSRWNPGERTIRSGTKTRVAREKFWDYRPFSRVIVGLRALLTIKDYILVNQLEGLGHRRIEARFIIANSSLDSC